MTQKKYSSSLSLASWARTNKTKKLVLSCHVIQNVYYIDFFQEPITSQVGLFLDEAFFCGYILHITVNYAITSDWLLKTNSWERLI